MIEKSSNKQPASILYHYCSTESFYKILETKEIHLSDINYSNDSAEIRWGREMVLETILEAIKNDQSSSNDIKNKLIQFYHTFNLNCISQSPFVFCLSEEGDLLSQWIGYADDGHGVSIGFKTDVFIKKLNIALQGHTHPNVFGSKKVLDRVIYDLEFQKGKITVHVDEFIDNQKEEAVLNKEDAALSNLCHFCKIFKNPAFKEEKEWRILTSPIKNATASPDILFKPRKAKLVPYIKLPFKDYPYLIEEIILGPKNQNSAEDIKLYLQLYLNRTQEIKVKYSKATYR